MAVTARLPGSGIPADSPLTTKEGWAAFVRHEPSPPQLLPRTSPARPRSGPPTTRPVAEYHADLPLVSTPVLQKVISTCLLLIQLNRHQVSARRGVIISGASGTGKTTALTQLGRTHELVTRSRHPGDDSRLPVIYVTVPPAATPRMLAAEFARFLGLEFPARANLADITNTVCAVAAHVHADLVLVDEIDNIRPATRSGAEASDQLKYLAERLPATFAYAGVDVEAQGLFAGPGDGRSPAGSPSSPPPRSATAPPRSAAPGRRWSPRWRRCCACTGTPPAPCPGSRSSSTAAAAA